MKLVGCLLAPGGKCEVRSVMAAIAHCCMFSYELSLLSQVTHVNICLSLLVNCYDVKYIQRIYNR